MTTYRRKKWLHEGSYVAEVEVDLVESDEAWGPYLTPQDARKLDDIRKALQREDIVSARKLARVYRLIRVSAA